MILRDGNSLSALSEDLHTCHRGVFVLFHSFRVALNTHVWFANSCWMFRRIFTFWTVLTCMINDGLCWQYKLNCIFCLDFLPVVFGVWISGFSFVCWFGFFFLMAAWNNEADDKNAYKNSGKFIIEQHGLISYFSIHLVIRPFQLSVSNIISFNSST